MDYASGGPVSTTGRYENQALEKFYEAHSNITYAKRPFLDPLPCTQKGMKEIMKYINRTLLLPHFPVILYVYVIFQWSPKIELFWTNESYLTHIAWQEYNPEKSDVICE